MKGHIDGHIDGHTDGRLDVPWTHQSAGTSILQILKLRSAIPATGTRSLPVAKCRSFFCSSRGNARTTSQKNLQENQHTLLTGRTGNQVLVLKVLTKLRVRRAAQCSDPFLSGSEPADSGPAHVLQRAEQGQSPVGSGPVQVLQEAFTSQWRPSCCSLHTEQLSAARSCPAPDCRTPASPPPPAAAAGATNTWTHEGMKRFHLGEFLYWRQKHRRCSDI